MEEQRRRQDGFRASTETDRRALLAAGDESSLRTVVAAYDGDLTPRLGSPALSVRSHGSRRRHGSPSPASPASPASSASSVSRISGETPQQQNPPQNKAAGYRGFPSEEAYLEALREWAEEKKYIQPTEEAQMLTGFYGTKTMKDYTGKRDGEGQEQQAKRGEASSSPSGLKKMWRARKNRTKSSAGT